MREVFFWHFFLNVQKNRGRVDSPIRLVNSKFHLAYLKNSDYYSNIINHTCKIASGLMFLSDCVCVPLVTFIFVSVFFGLVCYVFFVIRLFLLLVWSIFCFVSMRETMKVISRKQNSHPMSCNAMLELSKNKNKNKNNIFSFFKTIHNKIT